MRCIWLITITTVFRTPGRPFSHPSSPCSPSPPSLTFKFPSPSTVVLLYAYLFTEPSTGPVLYVTVLSDHRPYPVLCAAPASLLHVFAIHLVIAYMCNFRHFQVIFCIRDAPYVINMHTSRNISNFMKRARILSEK
jgi:hypothetical protein